MSKDVPMNRDDEANTSKVNSFTYFAFLIFNMQNYCTLRFRKISNRELIFDIYLINRNGL
ncbi:hypothetical protein [Cloacibacterium caeni]|uniref:hypothetical protein n=1 Tax=Cloacibacterium caeni TaxID=2004710 RepID=UPI001BCB921C|nr:hypothetical protein [Cloacibacterium caeni]